MEPNREKQTAPPLPSSFRIFVSHSHKDNDFCLKLVKNLRSYLSDDDAVWYDASGGLHGGDAWWQKIVEQMKQRNVFIVVLSPDAMESLWVHDEINLAWQRKNSPARMLIIPVLYRQCDIRDDLRTRQVISFLPPKPYETAFQELLLALENSLYPKSKTPPPKLPPLYTSPLERPRTARQTPPMRMPPRSQVYADMPDLERVPSPDRQREETPAPVPTPRSVEMASAGQQLASVSEAGQTTASITEEETIQEKAATVRFAIDRLSMFLSWFCLLLEIILFVRFILKLIGADPNNLFAAFLYALTDIILFPFANIVASPSFGLDRAFEWSTLIAMLTYWLIFWGIRRLLRISISPPEEPVE